MVVYKCVLVVWTSGVFGWVENALLYLQDTQHNRGWVLDEMGAGGQNVQT